MKKIRVGHIGTYHDHSAMILNSLKKLSDIYEVIGVVCESDQRYNEIKDKEPYEGQKFMSMEELFSYKPDACVIEGFELDNLKYAKECVKRKIHVHIDKPAGDDLKEFREVLDIAKRENLCVHMGYMYRYNPAFIKTKELIKSGALGEIYCVEAHMDCEHTKEKRQWLENFEGGMMFFLGCHLVDLIYNIMGEPESVIPYNTATMLDGVDAKDYGMALFKYKNAISFAKTCAAEIGGFLRRQLAVCGSCATVQIKPFEKYIGKNGELETDMTVVFKKDAPDWGNEGEKFVFSGFDRYDDMMREFARCAAGEIKNPYDYEYEYNVQRLVLEAVKSL